MRNKLGLENDEIESIESKLYDLKSSFIDYRVTFNVGDFNLDYLIKLHDFLFGDLYYDTDSISDRYKDEDKILFESKIQEIISLIKSEGDPGVIASLINELIDYQIFDDGNSRTIHLFFNNVIDCYEMHNEEYANMLKEEIKNQGRKY